MDALGQGTPEPDISGFSPPDQMDRLSEFWIGQCCQLEPLLLLGTAKIVAARPRERRIRLPPSDLSAIREAASCPFCALSFKVSAGFMSHLIVEHWCAREFALVWWLDLVSDRAQKQVGLFPVHLEVH